MSTIPARASRTQDYDLLPDIQEEDDYPRRPPRSAIHYQVTQGNPIIQQGNRRIVIHQGPPPKPKRSIHWSLILGFGMAIMPGLYFGITLAASWWLNHQLDTTYGMPRTYQVDAVVGHNNDSHNSVIGSSVYIRNLSAFTGGDDSYSVKVITAQDRQTALESVRSVLSSQLARIHDLPARPCAEVMTSHASAVKVVMTCQFVTFTPPADAEVLSARVVGSRVLVHVKMVMVNHPAAVPDK